MMRRETFDMYAHRIPTGRIVLRGLCFLPHKPLWIHRRTLATRTGHLFGMRPPKSAQMQGF
jgi:hypothetical protein